MNRPLRIDCDAGLHHITARGNRRGAIFRTDSDRLTWLTILGEACALFHFKVHAYCLMGNHYHLLLETTQGQLARGMRYLNGKYSQYFNRQHKLSGHLFQGRYHAILCQQESYLLELARYIVLNPQRAGMIKVPAEWPWSSYRATVGLADAPPWLQTDNLLALFGSERANAICAFEQFVLAGIGGESPLKEVSNQVLLGDKTFRARFLDEPIAGDITEIARAQRRVTLQPLPDYFNGTLHPKVAMAKAYLSLGYSMTEIARYHGVSVRTVSRAVKRLQQQVSDDPANEI